MRSKRRLKKQIERYKSVAANPSEGTIVRTYIETLLDLPWDKEPQITQIWTMPRRFWTKTITD